MATNGSDSSGDFEEWRVVAGPFSGSGESGQSGGAVDPSDADTPAAAWSAVDETKWASSASPRPEPAPPLAQYQQSAQTPDQAQPFRPEPYVPAPMVGPAPAAGSDNRGLTIAVITLAAIAVVLLVGGLAYFYFSSPSETTATGSTSASRTQSSTRQSSTSTEPTTTQRRRAEDFSVPSSWRFCSGSGRMGDLNLVYAEDVGGNITTCNFATNVRNAFVERYQISHELDGTVTASSPTTGKTYTMTCHDEGDYVTCTGGSNATVHIV